MKMTPALLLACAPLFAIGGCTEAAMQGAAAETAHNQGHSRDWPGTYRGVLPCADCEGIDTSLTFIANGRYLLVSKYLGKSAQSVTSEGVISWSDGGKVATLRDSSEAVAYRIGQNQLTRLTPGGSAITGPLADHYVLAKTEQAITETYWKLVELNGLPIPTLDKEPHIILKTQNSRVNGNGGCNRLTGSYTLDAEQARITFGPIATTRMRCAPAMDIERTFTEALAVADSYILAGGILILNRGSMARVARFEAVYLR